MPLTDEERDRMTQAFTTLFEQFGFLKPPPKPSEKDERR